MSSSNGPRMPRLRRVLLVARNSPSASAIHCLISGDRLPSLGTRLLMDGGHGRSRVITPQMIPSCRMKVSTRVFPQLDRSGPDPEGPTLGQAGPLTEVDLP